MSETAADHHGIETLPEVTGMAAARRGRHWRRVGLAALVVFVLLGASGLLGVREATTSASGGGYTASFSYPRIARAGWAVPWELRVTHPGGFDGAVTVAMSADYFDIYESQRFWPEPAQETRDRENLYLTFDEPPGDTLVVSYDAFIQPSAQTGKDVALTIVTDGVARVTLQASTVLLP